ncbi:MAG: hypothetical protein WB952_20595 [Terriglobales bacterium]
MSRSASFFFSPDRISSIFVKHEKRSSTIELGSTGGFLVSKLAGPTKVLCSGASHQTGFHHPLFPEAKPDVRAAAAGILREANPAVRKNWADSIRPIVIPVIQE